MLGSNGLDTLKPSRFGFEMRMFQGANCDHVDQGRHRDLFHEVDVFWAEARRRARS
jgi:hypothetical protein